jgi:hypothetical protein
MSLVKMGYMAVINLAGAVIYATRVNIPFTRETQPLMSLTLSGPGKVASLQVRYMGLQPSDLPHSCCIRRMVTSTRASRYLVCHGSLHGGL